MPVEAHVQDLHLPRQGGVESIHVSARAHLRGGFCTTGKRRQPASVLRLAALAFAQRAFAAAEILARAAALILRLPLPDPLRYFAQRNF